MRSDVESLERDQNSLPSASETIQLRNIFTHINMGMGMGKGKGKGCLHAKVRNSSTERLMCGIDESPKRTNASARGRGPSFLNGGSYNYVFP